MDWKVKMQKSKVKSRNSLVKIRDRRSSFKKRLRSVLVFVFLLVVLSFFNVQVRAEVKINLMEIENQMADLKRALELSVAATTPLEAEVDHLEKQIAGIRTQLKAQGLRISELEESIEKREKDLAVQYRLLSARIRSYYKRSKKMSPFLIFFSSANASQVARNISYQAAAADEDKRIIISLTSDLLGLEEDKEQAEADRKQLGLLQAGLDREAEFFKGEIAGAKKYQSELSGKIAELSAKQQAILSEKAGTFQTTVGEVPLADDPNARPDYNPGFSPAFAAFSFGAPHYKGMSQYGAFGRAKSGQGYEEILRAYYGDVRIETVDTNFDISTTVGSKAFEDNYMKGIAEMPTKWANEGGFEALKAQAIAARSYALAYTGWRMGDRSVKKAICTTEACQVYRSSKAGNPGRWGDAVNDTRGKILVGNGSSEVVNAWYASTSGGYQESYSSLGHTTPGFWDADGGRGGWTSKAWENIGGSPWFYKGWYKSRSGDACGRSHPWLTGEEMADVLNAWVVLIKHGQSDDRVTPEGGCWGGNPYSTNELRSRAEGLSVGYSKVTGVGEVVYAENGVTSRVSFVTDKGRVEVGGMEFKKAFNLRAPGRIALKSGLFNIEKK